MILVFYLLWLALRWLLRYRGDKNPYLRFLNYLCIELDSLRARTVFGFVSVEVLIPPLCKRGPPSVDARDTFLCTSEERT